MKVALKVIELIVSIARLMFWVLILIGVTAGLIMILTH